jgi:hypothetical protein
MEMREPPAELQRFLEPYDPEVARLFFAARTAVLAAAPQARELIYDAYNAVAAAYSFTHRMKEAFCHVAAYRDHVNLGFNRGAGLADPDGLLAGTGKHIRHIRIGAIADLQRPSVRRLVRAAAQEGARLGSVAPAGPPRSVVQAVYARKRRPSPIRRPDRPAGR